MLSRLLKKHKDTFPAYEKKPFFADEQKSFYARLRRALPRCYIFPNVELCALMAPSSTDPKQQKAENDQLNGRKVDFAVFDARLNLLCVIELTMPSHLEPIAVSNGDYLKSAGIKSISWSRNQLPSADQILRILAPFSSLEPPKLDAADAPVVPVSKGFGSEADRGMGAKPVIHPPRPPEPIGGDAFTLSVAAIEELAPHRFLEVAYPHVWERICLFCNEPKHLAQYLTSLSIQDRAGKRAGFPPEVIIEITDIQSANARFVEIAVTRASWNTTFVNR